MARIKGSMQDDALIEQALRVYRRYEVEIVQALGLCPWAERARKEGRVAERVLAVAGDRALEASLEALGELAAAEHIEVGLLIYPRIPLARLPFEHFLSALRDADARRHPIGSIPFAMAAFHPDAPADRSDAERFIPFLRRTPDPTVQVVRRSVLDRIHDSAPQGTAFVDLRQLSLEALAAPPARSLRQRIACHNLEAAERVGIGEIERRFAEIRRDRDESYERLSLGA